MAFPRKFSSLQECEKQMQHTNKKNFEYFEDTSNTLPKIRTLQRARHSKIQSDLSLQTKAQYQMKYSLLKYSTIIT